MLKQAYVEDCLSRTQCHEWYQRFKSGRTSIEDDPKSGRPRTSMDADHVEKVLAVIRKNRRLTVCEVAAEVGMCKISCHLILTEKRKIRRVAAKFVPRLLIHGFLTKHKTTVFLHLPYSPDLAPADLFLVPDVEILTKSSPILDCRGDIRKFDRGLRAVPQNTFQDTFQKWKKRWEWCIKSGGEYFEGDKFD